MPRIAAELELSEFRESPNAPRIPAAKAYRNKGASAIGSDPQNRRRGDQRLEHGDRLRF
jgi:hypothetical protein